MDALKLLNALVRFLLELCMLAAVGYWGFTSQSNGWLKVLFGIGLPILIATLWGLYIAPKAFYPLHGASYLTLEMLLLFSGSAALFASGKSTLGWVYSITVVVNRILIHFWNK